jgi:hypothetical protein
LICYGASHVLHRAAGQPPPGGLVSLVEQRTGQRVYSIIALTPLAGDPGGTFRRLAHYPRGTVIPAASTWLGLVNSADVLSPALAPGPSGQPANINCGISLGSVIDGALYLGQASDLTTSHPDPAIYLDQAYWAELQQRNILQGGVPGLNALRQEQSARFTPQAVPPSLLCHSDPITIAGKPGPARIGRPGMQRVYSIAAPAPPAARAACSVSGAGGGSGRRTSRCGAARRRWPRRR